MTDRTSLPTQDYSARVPTQDFGSSDSWPRADGPGGPRDGLRVEPPSTGSRRRLPELILGILLIAGCALGAVLLAMSGRSRTPVLALDNDVQRGQTIEEDDLATVQLGTDGNVSYLPQGDVETVVGQVALTDLPSGALLTPEMLGEPVELLEDGDGQVGLTVGLHQMPSLGLAVGDRVNVVVRPSGEAPSIAGQATVADIEQLERGSGQEDQWYVSLQARQAEADLIAMAVVAESPFELVLVGD